MTVAKMEIFPEDVDSAAHPNVHQLRQMFFNVAEMYSTSLELFAVARGTVTFAFAKERVTCDILDSLRAMSNGVFK